MICSYQMRAGGQPQEFIIRLWKSDPTENKQSQQVRNYFCKCLWYRCFARLYQLQITGKWQEKKGTVTTLDKRSTTSMSENLAFWDLSISSGAQKGLIWKKISPKLAPMCFDLWIRKLIYLWPSWCDRWSGSRLFEWFGSWQVGSGKGGKQQRFWSGEHRIKAGTYGGVQSWP